MAEDPKAPTKNISQGKQEEKPKKKLDNKIYLLVAFSILFVLTVFISKNYFSTNQLSDNQVQAPLFLSIESPKTEATLLNGELLVQGRTLANTTVVIYSDIDQTSLQSDSNGNFKDTVVVGDQGGLVRITAFSDNGIEMSKTIDVGNLNVLGKSDQAPGRSNGNNSGGNSGNNQGSSNKEDKGNQKQEDKAQNSNQGQSQNQGQTQQTQTTPKVKVQKPISVSDFIQNKVKIEKAEKIGAKKMLDILSEGSTQSATLGKNLKLKKMEASPASGGAQLKRHAVSGVITQISGGVITLAHQIHRERTYTIYYNGSTEISMKDDSKNDDTATESATPTPGSGTESGVLAVSTESATPTAGVLTVGMRIAVVGIPSEGGLLATRIHVIPGKAIGVFNRQPISSESATPTVNASPSAIPSATPTATLTPIESPTPTVGL